MQNNAIRIIDRMLASGLRKSCIIGRVHIISLLKASSKLTKKTNLPRRVLLGPIQGANDKETHLNRIGTF